MFKTHGFFVSSNSGGPSPSSSPFAELFANGEQGIWIDPSDLSTLWQDVAGTIPVAADGDPVRRADDKSGNGWNLTAFDTTKPPAWRTDGTLCWLEVNATDKLTLIAHPFAAYAAKTAVTRFAGFYRNTGTTGNMFGDRDLSAGQGMLEQVTSGNPPTVEARIHSPVSQIRFVLAGANANIVTSRFDASQPSTITGRHALRNNGAAIVPTLTAGTPTSQAQNTGSDSGFSLSSYDWTDGTNASLIGRVYQYVGVARAVTDGEVSACEAKLAELSGVTI